MCVAVLLEEDADKKLQHIGKCKTARNKEHPLSNPEICMETSRLRDFTRHVDSVNDSLMQHGL